jgi:hypothetical protein
VPGHFEIVPRREGKVGWEFVADGRSLAQSPHSFAESEEAKADAAELVLAIRQATYGQRFASEIADAVRELGL